MVTGDQLFDPLSPRLGNAIVAAKPDANQQLQLVDYFGSPGGPSVRGAGEQFRPHHQVRANSSRRRDQVAERA
jgi:hypothetical protein